MIEEPENIVINLIDVAMDMPVNPAGPRPPRLNKEYERVVLEFVQGRNMTSIGDLLNPDKNFLVLTELATKLPGFQGKKPTKKHPEVKLYILKSCREGWTAYFRTPESTAVVRLNIYFDLLRNGLPMVNVEEPSEDARDPIPQAAPVPPQASPVPPPLWPELTLPTTRVDLPPQSARDRREYELECGTTCFRFPNSLNMKTADGLHHVVANHLCALNALLHALLQLVAIGATDCALHATRRSPLELRELIALKAAREGPVTHRQEKLRASLVLNHYQHLDPDDQQQMYVEETTLPNGTPEITFTGCGRTDARTMFRTSNVLTCAQVRQCSNPAGCQFFPQPMYQGTAGLSFHEFQCVRDQQGAALPTQNQPCQCGQGTEITTSQVSTYGFFVFLKQLHVGKETVEQLVPFHMQIDGHDYVRGPFMVMDAPHTEHKDLPGQQCPPHAMAVVVDEGGERAYSIDDAMVGYDICLIDFLLYMEGVFYLPNEHTPNCSKSKYLPYTPKNPEDGKKADRKKGARKQPARRATKTQL